MLVSLEDEGNFLTAQVLIASPPDVGGLHVIQPYERLSFHEVSPYEVIAWEFVVTKTGAKSVAVTEADATKPGNRSAPAWIWNGSHWRPGDWSCGSSGGSGGGAGPQMIFISACRG